MVSTRTRSSVVVGAISFLVPPRRRVEGGFNLAKKKKPSPPGRARKKTAAEQARSTFDADPPPLTDAELAELIQQQRPIVETQRPPPSQCILSREEILARVPLTYP